MYDINKCYFSLLIWKRILTHSIISKIDFFKSSIRMILIYKIYCNYIYNPENIENT